MKPPKKQPDLRFQPYQFEHLDPNRPKSLRGLDGHPDYLRDEYIPVHVRALDGRIEK